METTQTTAVHMDTFTSDYTMNTSTSTAIEERFLHHAFVHFDSLALPIISSLITFTGCVGNILVIYIILSRPRLHNVINISLLNLAFADILFVIFVPTFITYQVWNPAWPFGEVLCKLTHYFLYATVYVEVYIMVFITVFRYLMVVHHTTTANICTKRNTAVAMATLWILMLLIHIPVYLTFESRDYTDYTTCTVKSMTHIRALTTCIFVLGYILPLLVIGVFSSLIARHLHRQKLTSLDREKQSQQNQNKRKVTLVIMLVVVAFAVLWLPLHITDMYVVYGDPPRSRSLGMVRMLCAYSAFLNSCVNPIIYNFASQEFRAAYVQVTCFWFRKCRGSRDSTSDI